MSKSCKKILVSGLVQGVFFRDSTRQIAVGLDLSGGVRNLFDGRVEVLVCGEEIQLEELIKWLKIGPKYAKVSTIEVIDLSEIDLEEQNIDIQQNNGFSVWPNK